MSAIDRGRTLFQRLSPASVDPVPIRVDGQTPEYVASDICLAAAGVPKNQWNAAMWTEHGYSRRVRNDLYTALLIRARRVEKRDRWPTVAGRDMAAEFAGFAMAESLPTREGAKLRTDEVRAAAHGIPLGIWRREWGYRYESIYRVLTGWSDACLEQVGRKAA